MAKYLSPISTQVSEETAVDDTLRTAKIRFFDSFGDLRYTGIILGTSTPRPLDEMDENAKSKWRNIYGISNTKDYMKIYYGMPIRYVSWVDEWLNNTVVKRIIISLPNIPIIGQPLYNKLEHFLFNIGELEYTIVPWKDDFHSRLTESGIDILNIKDFKSLHIRFPIPFIDQEERRQYALLKKFEFEDPMEFQKVKAYNKVLTKKVDGLESENEILREKLMMVDSILGDLKRKSTSEAMREEVRKQKALKEVDDIVIGPLDTGESELNE